jgi:hypothetical protein
MLQLKNKVKLTIKSGDEKVFDNNIFVQKLTRKEERKLQKKVLEAQELLDSDQLEALDTVEEAAKLRFDKSISGDEDAIFGLKELAETYGYSVILAEIDEQLGND